MNEKDKNKYILEFSIPRNIELNPGAKLNCKRSIGEIYIELINRELVFRDVDTKKTTAIAISNTSSGEVYWTKFKVTFLLKKNFFKEVTDEDLAKDFLQGERKSFFINHLLIELNQLFKVHQYVNNKYNILPLSKNDFSSIKITLPNNNQVLISSPMVESWQIFDKSLQENTTRLVKFYSEKNILGEPTMILGYAKQFYNMGIYRIAITESQASVEYILDLLLTHNFKKNNDDTLEFYNKSKQKLDLIDVKLGMYLKLATNQDIKKDFPEFNYLKKCVNIRNEIIHGSQIKLTNDETLKIINTYEKLFYYLLSLIK